MAAARNYLVTGGAGFIGSSLVKGLLEAGHQVVVLDDFSRGKPERLQGLNCEIVHGDVRDHLDMGNALAGVDAVIHLAYLQGTQTFYEEPRRVLDVAVRGMLNLLGACEQWGVGDLMLISSSEAYQVASVVPTPETIPLTVPDVLNPRYSYGGGKIACELLAMAWHRAGVLDRVMIARPHNIIGPDMGREHVIPEFCLRMNQLVRQPAADPDAPLPFRIQGSGMETRSFCHVADCIAQLQLILAKAPPGPSIWHVGMEDERTILEVAQAVALNYGRTIKILPGTLPQGSPPRRLPDTSKIRSLGFTSKHNFDDTIGEIVSWYRAHG